MNSTQASPSWLKSLIRPLGLSLSAGLLLSGMLIWSGCAEDQEKVTLKASKPFTQPVIDKKLSLDDFAFPSQPPSLARGKEVFQQQCMKCHTADYWQQRKVQMDLAYSTPIDFYLMLTTGEAPPVTHPSDERKDVLPKLHAGTDGKKLEYHKLTRDERWAVIFYTRHLAGYDDVALKSRAGTPLNIASDVFGGNCAVCHGTRGFADGFLQTGRPSKHGVEGAKIHTGLFEPPPANFHDYKRMYNRTDAQLHRYIAQGIYPSAMPRWYGRIDHGKDYVFNDELIWKMARHVRAFSYTKDLPDTDTTPLGIIPTSDEASWYRPQTRMDMPIGSLAPAPAVPESQATRPVRRQAQENQKAGESHS